MAALMFQILITRIFSVTLWYHYAFAAISIAMFGLTAGANWVYLAPSKFPVDQSRRLIGRYSFLFGISIVVCFLVYLAIPYEESSDASWWRQFTPLFMIYVVISVPFVLLGVAICLALTRFPDRVGSLYAADLLGAAVGCPCLVFLMELTDGPTAVLAVAMVALLGALSLLWTEVSSRSRWGVMLLIAGLLAATVGNTILAREGRPFLRLVRVKGIIEPKPIHETWNSFSRIQVGKEEYPEGELRKRVDPYTQQALEPVREHPLLIDACARTDLTNFEGDFGRLVYLKGDIVNFGYHLRPVESTLIIGTGGGRDVLSALVFDATRILGVDINDRILSTVNHRFADFTGHLDQNPRVRFVNDEARSYVTRHEERFDIIQVPMIDTWAATAAGAFVLTENGLYTLDAWKDFTSKLTDDGILAFTRWHIRDAPYELYRLLALAAATLKELGVENPRDHLLLASHYPYDAQAGLVCCCLSLQPFTAEEVRRAEEACATLGHSITLTPAYALDSVIEKLAGGAPVSEVHADLPVYLDPPTDDSPFFFNMLRFGSWFEGAFSGKGPVDFNLRAIHTLLSLLCSAVILTVLFILIPLFFRPTGVPARESIPYLVYFAAIGLGFMLIEISQMQRLIIFLGHPVYGLTVVLFSLLLSMGLGSWLVEWINPRGKGAVMGLLALLSILILFGSLTPLATHSLRAEATVIRIAAATGILGGLGLFLGMALPLGLRLAIAKSEGLPPWLWGINGAMSVCASIAAIVLALAIGISATFWVGFGCYVAAFGAFLRMRSQPSGG